MIAARAAVPGVDALVDLLGVGLGAIGGTGTERLRAAVQAEIEDAVLRRLPEVEKQVAALQREGVPINATDFARLVQCYARAWRDSADPRKRKLLEDAFVRSFDKELYESGLLNVLWERLETLGYGDLRLLGELVEAKGGAAAVDEVRKRWGVGVPSKLGTFHGENLARAGLVAYMPQSGVGGCNPTDLGHRMWQLAWEQLPDPNVRAESGG